MAEIIGATNKYCVSKEWSEAGREETLFAKKGWLSKTWQLYKRIGQPALPMPDREDTIRNLGKTRKVDFGLSLSEVFDRLKEHEESPPQGQWHTVTKRPMPEWVDITISQDIPKDNPRYWRNVKRELGV